MPTDRQILKANQLGVAQTMGLVTPNLEVARMHRRVYQFQVTDGGAAGTAFTETANLVPHAGRVVAAFITPPIAVAFNASNFLTLTIARRTAGGGSTTIGTSATSAVGYSAFTPAAVTLTAANVELSANDSLTVAVAKSGTGVALAAATSAAVVTVIVEED